MSMLSAQVDELRTMAESVGLAMPQAATLMMEAADTIWELRCKANAELDVLHDIDQLRRDLSGYHGQLKAHNDLQRHCERQKEQLAALQEAHKPIKDERDLYKRQADRLAAENARLRELVDYVTPIAWYAASERERDRMRELGVEQ